MKIVTKGGHAQKILICGRPDTGKTTLAKYILSNEPDHMVYDTNQEYEEFNHYVPKSYDFVSFQRFCSKIWNQGNLLFCVDEAEIYMHTSPQPLKGPIGNIVHRGRHRGIGFMAITRRLANLHTDIFSFADHIFIFKLTKKQDLDYLGNFLDDPDQAKDVKKINKWWFYYYNEDREIWKLCPPLRLGSG